MSNLDNMFQIFCVIFPVMAALVSATLHVVQGKMNLPSWLLGVLTTVVGAICGYTFHYFGWLDVHPAPGEGGSPHLVAMILGVWAAWCGAAFSSLDLRTMLGKKDA